MIFERSSGILLHPTSLPGPYGIGEIGPSALRWIDFLHASHCRLWQLLPLGPTGYGDSPYQCFSAFAGSPYLISLEALLAEDLLHSNDLVEMPSFPEGNVDFGALIPWKLGVLDRAYIRFEHAASKELSTEFTMFQSAQGEWLDDFALFMALKEAHGGAPWSSWEAPLRNRQPTAIKAATEEYAVAIQRQKFYQFIFFRQWAALRTYAHDRGIRIIGDIPIFVAHDSADVWAHPEYFYLDGTGKPTVVAGVPPDYFSPTGQLWGNPLYRWEVHKDSGYQWWIARLRAVLDMVDIVRLDHFRGFAAYWEVAGDARTAETGCWVPAPGMDFFTVVQRALGDLPIIAEDLGVITPDVEQMRDRYNLPGMKILQFAFASGPRDDFLPHNYVRNCVVYTGTHDNDTARGWYERVPEDEKSFYRRYLARDGRNVAWDLIRACWASVAVFSLAPMQDFLDLGNEARMNYPGNPSGNWTWRMRDLDLENLSKRIRELNYLYLRYEGNENGTEQIDELDQQQKRIVNNH
ncbi:MAG: 4-alpha-glucanotransferase [Chloroflexota bacterium]|nr:4-alpha-glucanotransferase [Chloroflexota bacterium]